MKKTNKTWRIIPGTCSCGKCEGQWTEHPFHAITCPTCYAAKGSPCVRPSEHTVFSVGYTVHIDRELLCLDLGLHTACPESNWERERRGEPLNPNGWIPKKKQPKTPINQIPLFPNEDKLQ